MNCADAVDFILSHPGFYGDFHVGVLSTVAQIRVDGREPHFLKFEVLEGMHGMAEVFLEEARVRVDVEPFLQYVGPPPPPKNTFRVVRPRRVLVRLSAPPGRPTLGSAWTSRLTSV